MCGRYHFDETTIKNLEELVMGIEKQEKLRQICGEIHPDDEAPVLLSNGYRLVLSWQRWGFPHFQRNGVIFNARAETVIEKKMFADSIQRRRAVIPCAWFYEWSNTKEKIAFRRHDASTLYLAGCYHSFTGKDRFVILTTAANPSVTKIHDRMPLILEKASLVDWFADTSTYQALLRQNPVLLHANQAHSSQQLHLFE